MNLRCALCLALAGALLAGGGCAGPGGDDGQPDYRTVQAELGRDTEAAKKAHARGLDHLDRGELEPAAEAFRQALGHDSEFGPAHNNLGKVYFQQDRLYRAAKEFDYARRLMPKHPAPHNNLGLLHERSEEFDRAIEHYRRAVELGPKRVEFKVNLARALIRRGDRTQEVRKLLEQILDEGENADWLMWAKRQLATMREPGQ